MQNSQEKIYWTSRPELQIPKNDLGEIIDILDNKIAFFGNVDLLPAGVKLNYNLDMIEEIVKCRDDIIYFAENYYKAQTPNGFNFITLHDYQKIVISDMMNNQHYILKLARQSGKCCHQDTKLNIMKNGIEKEITFKDLFEECKKEYNERTN